MRSRVLTTLATALLWSAVSSAQEKPQPFQTLTVEQAVEEAVRRNLSLLVEQANLTVAESAVLTARLRPNPVLSASAESLDLLGTGFDEVNQAGPPEYAVRVD